MRLLAEGKRFPKREKNMGFTICYGVTRELADRLGAYWYDHEKNKNTPYIMGADKDYMQPAEFIIDCEINKVISCAYSDGGLGRMDAGDVVGVLSSIQNIKDEMPHVWSWLLKISKDVYLSLK